MSNVAIIGCSYTDIHQYKRPNTETENWTYKLAKKYPQHQFRNYAKQATGVEYFRVVFDECYDWADYILIQTTHMQRRSVFIIGENIDESLEWTEHEISDNLMYMTNNGTLVTMSPGNVAIQGYNANKLDQKIWNQAGPMLVANTISDDISRKWIQRVRTDPKVAILNFEPDTADSVWNIFGADDAEWVSNGYVYAQDDHHFTDKGHTHVMENYILKTKVEEMLKV
ncbi:hypothetical protein N9Q27_00485 [bacterium]|nr:hypothetical protein [bacterium]